MGKRLYVGNLSFQTTEDGLREAFGIDGREVTDVKIMLERDTGRSRGFAFVEMATEEDAASAPSPFPEWGRRAGFAIGSLTTLFFMLLVVMSVAGLEVPESSRFLVLVVLGLGVAFSSVLLGGHAVARGHLPLPLMEKNPLAISVTGGVASFVLVLVLGSLLYGGRGDAGDGAPVNHEVPREPVEWALASPESLDASDDHRALAAAMATLDQGAALRSWVNGMRTNSGYASLRSDSHTYFTPVDPRHDGDWSWTVSPDFDGAVVLRVFDRESGSFVDAYASNRHSLELEFTPAPPVSGRFFLVCQLYPFTPEADTVAQFWEGVLVSNSR